VIPREGVERNICDGKCVVSVTEFVIPREGVERIRVRDRYFTLFRSGLVVIPREGVESESEEIVDGLAHQSSVIPRE